MTGRIVAIALLCAAGIAWAGDEDEPGGVIDTRSKPTTAAVAAAPTSAPSTAPTTKPVVIDFSSNPNSVAKFPTPTEMAMKLRRIREAKAALTKIAYLDLSSQLSEKPASFSLFGEQNVKTLRDVVNRLQKARDDKSIRAVLITMGAEMQMNLAQAQEIRDTLLELRRAGKKTFVYADSYDTTAYTIASGATNICLLGGGEIMIPGIGFETMFYKGTFDKVGVQADYIQIGEYKGAEEPYTRTAPSEELRGEFNKLCENLFSQIVDGISLSRNISSASVRQMIDDAMMTAQVAKERGFVDHLVDQDGLRELLKEEMGNDIDLVRDYGAPSRPQIDMSNPFALLASLNRKPEPSNKPEVAVVYAEGVISDGDGGGGLFGSDGVGSDTMRKTLRTAARDENIKAVVLRIDSPGGSALASEAIWQAIRRVSREAKKPVIVSVGSMAASGGYYLASAGDYIFADRCAIVGSIGVVGGKFVLKDLYDKLGLNTETFAQGRNADLFSSNAKWTDRQRRMVRTWMQQTYDQFTERVMTTRHDKIKDIDKVARGRIFIAQQAKDLGMVDELGGCDAAIAYAATQAGLEKGKYDVRTLPQPRTLADYLSGSSGSASGGDDDEESRMPAIQPKLSVDFTSALQMLPRSARKLIGQQIQLMQMLEKRPVLLVSPYVVTVK